MTVLMSTNLVFKNHSTSSYTHVLKEVVDYYRQHGSHVLLALLILIKLLIMLTIGCCSASYLIMTPVANDMLLFACLHIGIIISRCLLGDTMFLLSPSEFLLMLGKVAYFHHIYFDFIFIT